MTAKKLVAVHKSPPAHWVGDGFYVQPLFASLAFGQEVSPFLMLDYAAPHEFPPRKKPPGVGVHPHRGFETVTVVYDGEVEHRDSAGNSGLIGPGDVQWMTAGSGVLHEEFHSREHAARGGKVSMAQLWVNLPARDKRVAPGYQTLFAGEIPVVPVASGKGTLRVVAGAFEAAEGPARTFTPLNVWDVNVEAGAALDLEIPARHNVLVALLSGAVTVDGETVSGASLLTFDTAGNTVSIVANEAAKLLVLTGEPLNEPIAHYGPFVMNTEAEIRESIDAFRRGEMGHIEELA
ncbi:MAG: pirin family protein [Beijerinckiaceae bacterium]|jgi:quercetin 2,3-dioxygenase|nr:pirin family protein [Beijerinckiaceae bacterium]